jgi:hypothetical protein
MVSVIIQHIPSSHNIRNLIDIGFPFTKRFEIGLHTSNEMMLYYGMNDLWIYSLYLEIGLDFTISHEVHIAEYDKTGQPLSKWYE